MLSFLPSSLASRIEVAVPNATYLLDNRPTRWAAGLALLSTVSIIVLVVAAWRRPGRLVPPVVAVLASLPIAAGIVAAGWSPSGGERAVRVVFSSPLRVCVVALAIGAAGLISSVLSLVLRQSGHVQLLPYAIATFVLGLVTVAVADDARDIGRYEPLPVVAFSGETEGHVGREWDVPVVLQGETNRYWFFGWHGGGLAPISAGERAHWDVPETVHVRAERIGKNPIPVEARRGRITVRATVSIEGHRERSSPLLGMRVGDRFTYDLVERSGEGRLFYLVKLGGGSRTTKSAVEVSVIGTRERGPYRTFVYQVKRGDSLSFTELVAVDGHTRYFDVERHTPGEDVVSFLPPEGRGSGFDSFAKGFLAVITAGIIIVPGGGSASYGLSHTDPGPAGAPEALPD